MKEPIIINESKVIDRSGDVTFFETVTKAERHLEAIDVENEEYFAFDSQGHLLKLSVVRDGVAITDKTPFENCRNILKKVMIDYLLRTNTPEEELRELSFSDLLQRIEKKCTIL